MYKKALDDYASRLDELFSDLTELQSFGAAVELAEHLQFIRPLEISEARKATRNNGRRI
jgi:hypothetical protein